MKLKLFAFLFLGMVLSLSAQTSKLYLKETNGNYRVSNIGLTNNTVIISTNVIASPAVMGATTSSGASSAGQVVKLDSSGKVDGSMLPFSATNIFLTTEIAATADTHTNLIQYTFPETNGYVFVTAQVHLKSKNSQAAGVEGLRLIRIYGNTPPLTTNTISEVSAHTPSEAGQVLNATWAGIIGQTNTFVLQGVCDTTSANLVWGGTSKDYYYPTAGAGTGGTNSTGLFIFKVPIP